MRPCNINGSTCKWRRVTLIVISSKNKNATILNIACMSLKVNFVGRQTSCSDLEQVRPMQNTIRHNLKSI